MVTFLDCCWGLELELDFLGGSSKGNCREELTNLWVFLVGNFGLVTSQLLLLVVAAILL